MLTSPALLSRLSSRSASTRANSRALAAPGVRGPAVPALAARRRFFFLFRIGRQLGRQLSIHRAPRERPSPHCAALTAAAAALRHAPIREAQQRPAHRRRIQLRHRRVFDLGPASTDSTSTSARLHSGASSRTSGTSKSVSIGTMSVCGTDVLVVRRVVVDFDDFFGRRIEHRLGHRFGRGANAAAERFPERSAQQRHQRRRWRDRRGSSRLRLLRRTAHESDSSSSRAGLHTLAIRDDIAHAMQFVEAGLQDARTRFLRRAPGRFRPAPSMFPIRG